MEEICLDAWLIQSGNPVYDGCTLMTRETQLKIVGLCHGHYGYKRMAQVLGLDVEHVTCQAPGLNQVIYATHFEYRGKDAYPLLDEWIATKSEHFWATIRCRAPPSISIKCWV
jgi:alpha-galactosidase